MVQHPSNPHPQQKSRCADPFPLPDIANATHKGLQELTANHVFVGLVDRNLSLIQYQTKLLLVNHKAFR